MNFENQKTKNVIKIKLFEYNFYWNVLEIFKYIYGRPIVNEIHFFLKSELTKKHFIKSQFAYRLNLNCLTIFIV